jgi:hypothetical protein
MYRLVGMLLVVVGLCMALWSASWPPQADLGLLLGGVLFLVGWLLRSIGSLESDSAPAPHQTAAAGVPRPRGLPEPPYVSPPPPFEVTDAVASRSFAFCRGSATPRRVDVRVGRPVPGGDGRWLCPYEIRGLGPRGPQGVFGPDELGALLLALHAIPLDLEAAAEVEGGYVTYRGSRRLGFGSACAVLGRRHRRRRGELGAVAVAAPRPPIRSDPLATA